MAEALARTSPAERRHRVEPRRAILRRAVMNITM
jgi:hypothetical protein